MMGRCATSQHAFDWSWQGTHVRVGYDSFGDADDNRPLVVLLPAFSTVSTREEMRPLAARLTPEVRAVIPDWPGFGRGRHPALPHAPELHLAFLKDFLAQLGAGPAMVVAAGHAAGYALAASRRQPGIWSRIALIAPTWRGPLPTMMGGHGRLQDRLHAALRLPGIGHALYRLNVAAPVIAAMYRRHVYADRALVTPDLVRDKAAIARRRGGRFGSGAFVTGALDPLHDRATFLSLASPPSAPTLVLYGAATPPKSLAEIEALVRLPGITCHRLASGALGVHEECPDLVAAALRPFLLAH
jgi:pimeloyl-ACP methyl ester carboxylesterase